MTTHEFDAYLDMQHGDYFEPPYHEDSLLAEQERDFHEMESERTVALRREGAQEALTQLREVFRNHNSYDTFFFDSDVEGIIGNALLGLTKGGVA